MFAKLLTWKSSRLRSKPVQSPPEYRSDTSYSRCRRTGKAGSMTFPMRSNALRDLACWKLSRSWRITNTVPASTAMELMTLSKDSKSVTSNERSMANSPLRPRSMHTGAACPSTGRPSFRVGACPTGGRRGTPGTECRTNSGTHVAEPGPRDDAASASPGDARPGFAIFPGPGLPREASLPELPDTAGHLADARDLRRADGDPLPRSLAHLRALGRVVGVLLPSAGLVVE